MARLDPDEGAERVANFINSMTMEMTLLTRSLGKGMYTALSRKTWRLSLSKPPPWPACRWSVATRSSASRWPTRRVDFFYDIEPALDRCRGALLGLAIGDALGATVEFMLPGTFEPMTEILGGGPHGLMPGEWTDDTSMALCLAESLIQCEGFDAEDQLNRYVRWWKNGHLSSTGICFDIGITTRAALEKFQETGQPSGLTSPDTAGNGSIMRLAPVPIFYSNSMDDAVIYAGQSSATTHAAEEAVDACRYMAAVMVRPCGATTRRKCSLLPW